MVKLLVGLYQPQEGEIFYNQHRYNEVDLDQLRSQIGFVTQDTQLFAGTIKENLLFVAPNATDKECLEVLDRAACQTLLARADKGLDTMIGEGGVKGIWRRKTTLVNSKSFVEKAKFIGF